MTSFVHPDYPRQHAGVQRMSQGFASIRHFLQRASGAKGFASVLVAGGTAAAIVVAEQIVDAWADGHLLLAWVAMWVIVFALLALSGDAIGRMPRALSARYGRFKKAADRRAADRRTWEAALGDPRFMDDLQAARMRAERDAYETGKPAPLWPFAHMHGASYRQRTWS